ncbi:UNVERIFIED_CONTAM: hypothetical protein K2H54_038163 [Gekko kuhli]
MDCVVIVNGNKALRAFIDTDFGFSSVLETALESPSHWLHNIALHTHNAKITNLSMDLVKVQFGKFSGEIPVFVYSDEDSKFLIAFLYRRPPMCQKGEIKIQQKVVTQSQAQRIAKEVKFKESVLPEFHLGQEDDGMGTSNSLEDISLGSQLSANPLGVLMSKENEETSPALELVSQDHPPPPNRKRG